MGRERASVHRRPYRRWSATLLLNNFGTVFVSRDIYIALIINMLMQDEEESDLYEQCFQQSEKCCIRD